MVSDLCTNRIASQIFFCHLFCTFDCACILYSNHLNYLFIEKYVLFTHGSVAVVVAKEPVVEFCFLIDFFQKGRQQVDTILFFPKLFLDALAGAMRDNVVNFPIDRVQISPGFLVFRFGREFLLPPGSVIHTEFRRPPKILCKRQSVTV